MRISKGQIFLQIFLLVFTLAAIQPAYAYDKTKIPVEVKIGIRYKESATPLVSLYSKNGLEIGFYIGNEYRSLLSFLDDEEIIVRKDSYFMNVNGSFIEYNSNEQGYTNTDSLYGPIHIQIGESFGSREEAQAVIRSIASESLKPYLAYENGWKVWVGLFVNTTDAQNALQNLQTTIPQYSFQMIPQNAKRIQITDKRGNAFVMVNSDEQDYHIRPIPDKGGLGVTAVDGKNFRGSVLFKRFTDSDLTVINQLNTEEYLYGVVPREMSGSWPLEAQKAQAVAARNFTVGKMGVHKQYGFDLCATTHCQVYGGFDIEHEVSRRAVDETKNKILTYQGKLVDAYYHSNSGGYTEDSENVWSFVLPYIRGVEDSFSVGSPNDSWTQVFTKQELEDILNANGLNVGSITNISATEVSKNGRVLKLQIDGTLDRKILEKEKVRSLFGYNKVKSIWYTIESDGGGGTIYIRASLAEPPQEKNSASITVLSAEGTSEISGNQYTIYNGSEYKNATSTASQASSFTFKGKGWGHGLGMSQWGAKKMAELGYTYDQILKHYYTGTEIE
ncbi:MAG: SpoIID/LytB domain-containing protein [Bacillota bacterium]